MRRLLKVVIIIVAVVLIIGLAVWMSIDSIAATAVERGGTYALGVKTTVGSASVGLLSGDVDLADLQVANPEGYETPYLMRTGEFEIEVDPGSLFSDVIVVKTFRIKSLETYFEQKVGQSNVAVILENLKRFESPGEAPPEKKEGKKVRVDRILIEDVTAHVQTLPVGGQASTLNVKVPVIELNDVTQDDQGVVVSELVARIVPAIIAAVIEKGEGVIPGDMVAGIDARLREATAAIGGQAADLVNQARTGLGNVIKGIPGEGGKPLEDMGKKLGEGLDGIFKKKEAE